MLPLRNTVIYTSRVCVSTDPKSQTTLVKKDEKQEHVESVPANELVINYYWLLSTVVSIYVYLAGFNLV